MKIKTFKVEQWMNEWETGWVGRSAQPEKEEVTGENLASPTMCLRMAFSIRELSHE